MLRTRLWMGAILVALALGVLVVDLELRPWYPFLLGALLAVTLAGHTELLSLLDPSRRPRAWLTGPCVALLILSNWPAGILQARWGIASDPWHWVLGAFVAVILLAFLVEMATYRAPGGSVTRIAHTLLVVAYLGLLPSFFAQLRWLPPLPGTPPDQPNYHSTLALALAAFVPKVGDIGAYLAGHLLGRHRMTPLLSPRKTWEGFTGGLLASILVALLLCHFDPILQRLTLVNRLLAAGVLGLITGVTAVLGDLAESLIKRDSGQKDAARTVPGFGGLLDVIDSVLFASPVVYACLCLFRLAALHD